MENEFEYWFCIPKPKQVQIAAYIEDIKDDEDDDNACYLLGTILAKVGESIPEANDDALRYFSKSIDTARKQTDKSALVLYLSKRAKLYEMMGKTDSAVEDIFEASILMENKEYNSENDIDILCTKGILESLTRMKNVHSRLEGLKSTGAIPPLLYELLKIAGDEINRHTIKLDLHDQKFNLQDQVNQSVKEKIQVLEVKFQSLIVEVQEGRFDDQVNQNATDAALELIFKIIEEKVSISNLNPTALKTPEEIRNNSLLNDYFGALNNKLCLSLLEAEIICGGGHIKIDDVILAVSGASIPISFIPFVGSTLSKTVKSGVEMKKSNTIKEKATKLVGLLPDSESRKELMREIAITLTKKKSNQIKMLENSTNSEVDVWSRENFVDKTKNAFKLINIEKELYKSSAQILGCIDGMKIIKFIKNDGERLRNLKESKAISEELINFVMNCRYEGKTKFKIWYKKGFKTLDNSSSSSTL